MTYNNAISLLRQPNTFYPTFFGTGIGSASNRFPAQDAVVLGNHNDTTGPQNANYAVAIGYYSGQLSQQSGAIGIGYMAGYNTQGTGSVAIGYNTAVYNQGTGAIAIGGGAGYCGQGVQAIAIGESAGSSGQTNQSIAIGYQSGYINQANTILSTWNSIGGSLNGQTNVLCAIGTNLYVGGEFTTPGSRIAVYNLILKSVCDTLV
jgi:hypothetical protein